MSEIYRLILVLLSCLLISAGPVSRFHHHTDSETVCFCTDFEHDSCCHHHDGGKSHCDGNGCPYYAADYLQKSDSNSTHFYQSDCVAILTPDHNSPSIIRECSLCSFGFISGFYNSTDMPDRVLRGPPCA